MAASAASATPTLNDPKRVIPLLPETTKLMHCGAWLAVEKQRKPVNVTDLLALGEAQPRATEGETAFEIVLIEDSADYAKAVKTMLDYVQGETYVVKHFSKLGEALEYVPSSNACCVLLDLN